MYNFFFNLTSFFYLLSFLFYIVSFIKQKDKIRILGFFINLIGFFTHSFNLILRTIILEILPISNLYESLILFSWLIMLIKILILDRKKFQFSGFFVFPVVLFLIFFASNLDSDIKPPLPMLKSHWLGIHGLLCFLSYSLFTISFIFAILYLLQERELKYKRIGIFFFQLPSLELLDRISYKTILFGFLFLTLGIFSGSIWAKEVWGNYWRQDPKLILSLIMWLFYLFYLCTRLFLGWQAEERAYLSLGGFLITLFTYLGTDYFLKGLHSYL
ncbi:MAG: c-type cytochrome biogenesis protein CcsB [Candidatus Omnitrophica bacterium]|nr:c-type cytochrome biogenesis protein CcsB [Candidatus Omnitrophota bacterium]